MLFHIYIYFICISRQTKLIQLTYPHNLHTQTLRLQISNRVTIISEKLQQSRVSTSTNTKSNQINYPYHWVTRWKVLLWMRSGRREPYTRTQIHTHTHRYIHVHTDDDYKNKCRICLFAQKRESSNVPNIGRFLYLGHSAWETTILRSHASVTQPSKHS